MNNKDTFITMCHTIYDEIHGKEKVKKLFYPIKEVELNILINIYNNEFYKRPRMIQKYIESINTIENKIKLFGDKELDTSLFYINALQHYINKDY
tara:strand:+ start:256 stop:540 length:285 start_codon:yes stop_codon:yes gene_type:complete